MSCSPGNYFQENVNICDTACPDNYFADSITVTCKLCYDTCKTCYNKNENSCTHCKIGNVLSKNICASSC